MIGTAENNWSLNDTQVTFGSKSLKDIKLSKTQLSKIIQLHWLLGGLLELLLKVGLLLMTNVLELLVKSVLIPLRLSVTASAADVGIHQKILASGTTMLIVSNKEMRDMMKTINFVEDSGLVKKRIAQTIENKTNK